MCEWEKSKTQPAQSAEQTEEGSAEAAAPASESQEGQSASEGDSSSKWPPASAGVTYELCAGIVDKPDLSLEEIARQEVLEECGYDVPAAKLKRITSYRSGVGVTGAKQTMFYAEVSDDNCVSAGGADGLPPLVECSPFTGGSSLNLPFEGKTRSTRAVRADTDVHDSRMIPALSVTLSICM
ncbi:uridine diphosphate glucose pyrophosphatase NUDT14 isoform X2 [Xyrichtys novacula]|uniref:Uridine diphosphate glucose pyrophosphatase NUDT14 isoform X2 n=1 Tax=Xyrichtys novacula TaxID=13765 RepID=A0AAV1GX09_XYRNO|nr:uridine diphosphate glucose pyrophosphatase NUDT14 isoform X2 [Xyrichtys novacula]